MFLTALAQHGARQLMRGRASLMNTSNLMLLDATARITPRSSIGWLTKPLGQRLASTVAQGVGVESIAKTDKYVGFWLLGCCGTVFGTVVLGGVTRLTESGLSIVQWNPVKGVKAPTTLQEWEAEFELYKNYPEFKYCNKNMSLDDFKRIWYMEYAHRLWGRGVGLAFVVPMAAFWLKGWIKPQYKKAMLGFGALIGFQGALGWYMVKSGLDHDPQGAHVPRVSQYRLAAHLGSAFLLYSGMLHVALKHLVQPTSSFPGNRRLLGFGVGVSHLVFLTALSGAFVAGLDAGLIYNSFPKMGDHWVPPEYLSHQPTYRNFFENPSTVQFNHRILGITTFSSVVGLWLAARPANLPPRARLAVNAMLAVAIAQVSLGIATLLYYVPTELAATHQAGSLTLLTMAIWFVGELKKIVK